MKRNVKLWSNYFIYLGVFCILLIVLEIFFFSNFENKIVLTLGFLMLGVITGHFIFKEDKILECSEEPILLESIYGVNFKSIEKSGVLWEDILKAKNCLENYKKRTNFEWSSKNIFDILVVYYVDDTREKMDVKVFENTRNLVFQGIIKKTKDKLKLDTMDLSNFNSNFLLELSNYDSKLCKIEVVRPIEKDYLEKYFEVVSSDIKSIIYNVEEVIGGAY